MSRLQGYLSGVGLLGPGLCGWAQGGRVLRGDEAWRSAPTVLPVPEELPPAERRRTGALIRVALAVGYEAVAAGSAQAAQLPAVFTSSGGDGVNCHEICAALASPERQLSPTRFHNSVHNAAAGYWGIATGATAAANALCAYDASFAAGLIEALTQVVIERTPVLLVAYDTGYPEPIRTARPIPDAFGVALLLRPEPGPATHTRIEAHLSDAAATKMSGPLESLRRAIPAARSLPLLAALAGAAPPAPVLDYFAHVRVAVELAPCR